MSIAPFHAAARLFRGRSAIAIALAAATSTGSQPRASTSPPVLVELILWSAQHETTDATVPVLRTMRSDREAFIADVRKRSHANR